MKNAISSRSILTGLIAVAAFAALPTVASGQFPITNACTTNPITIDGKFTDALEWSTTTPATFKQGPFGNPMAVPPGTFGIDMFTYATLEAQSPCPVLNLMYDYLLGSALNCNAGDLAGLVEFPVRLPTQPVGQTTNIWVVMRCTGGMGFDFFIDVNKDGLDDALATVLGIQGSATYGPVPNSSPNFPNVAHMMVELEVPLDVPAGFSTNPACLPPAGCVGAYSPAPAFWGASFRTGTGGGPLQPASTFLFSFDSNGTATITPEPSSVCLLVLGCGLLTQRRRRSQAV